MYTFVPHSISPFFAHTCKHGLHQPQWATPRLQCASKHLKNSNRHLWRETSTSTWLNTYKFQSLQCASLTLFQTPCASWSCFLCSKRALVHLQSSNSYPCGLVNLQLRCSKSVLVHLEYSLDLLQTTLQLKLKSRNLHKWVHNLMKQTEEK